ILFHIRHYAIEPSLFLSLLLNSLKIQLYINQINIPFVCINNILFHTYISTCSLINSINTYRLLYTLFNTTASSSWFKACLIHGPPVLLDSFINIWPLIFNSDLLYIGSLPYISSINMLFIITG